MSLRMAPTGREESKVVASMRLRDRTIVTLGGAHLPQGGDRAHRCSGPWQDWPFSLLPSLLIQAARSSLPVRPSLSANDLERSVAALRSEGRAAWRPLQTPAGSRTVSPNARMFCLTVSR